MDWEYTTAIHHKSIQVEEHQWQGTVIPVVILQVGLGREDKEKEHTQNPDHV